MDNKKRDDYISWEEYFLAIAKLSSMRSKDPVTQVGACIVSDDNRILSIGYNGAPNGFDDDKFPWGKENENINNKFLYVCHAEMNAVLNYRGSTKDLEEATIFVDLFPCNECAKIIIQSGIKKVVYLWDKHTKRETNVAARKLFDECGVTYKQLKLDKERHIVIDLKNK